MTDEKKGEKKGRAEPFVVIKQRATRFLPTDRPYDEVEAIYSLELDGFKGGLVSVKGYMKQWGWGSERVYKLFREYGCEIEYDPEFTGKNQRGRIVMREPVRKEYASSTHSSKESKGLRRKPVRKQYASSTTYKEVRSKNTDTNVSVKESKDSLSAFSEKTQRGARRLFKYWNNILQRRDSKGKQRVKHKEGTQVHKTSLVYLAQLLNGTFFRSTRKHPKNFHPKWEERVGLTDEVKSTPMSHPEVAEGLGLLNRLFEEDYWGTPEEFYKWSLPALLYNPKTHESMFFWCLLTKIVEKPSYQEVEPRFEEYAEIIPAHIRPPTEKLVKPMTKIEKWYQFHIDNGMNLGNLWYDVRFFLLDFSDWAAGQDWVDEMNPDAMKPGGRLFEDFIKYVEEEKYVQFIREG